MVMLIRWVPQAYINPHFRMTQFLRRDFYFILGVYYFTIATRLKVMEPITGLFMFNFFVFIKGKPRNINKRWIMKANKNWVRLLWLCKVQTCIWLSATGFMGFKNNDFSIKFYKISWDSQLLWIAGPTLLVIIYKVIAGKFVNT